MTTNQTNSIVPMRKGSKRIQLLTSVAADMFLERGFDAVTIDDLIHKVGGSRRNVYSHFGSKDELFIETVTQLCAELSKPIEKLNFEVYEPRQALILFGQKLLDAVLQPRALALHRLMIAEGKRFPELSQAILKAGHYKASSVLATWIKGRQLKNTADIEADKHAVMSAKQYVDMIVTDIQLRALVGWESPAQLRAQIAVVVQHAADTFMQGTSLKGRE